jgi:hypothetical protein
MTDLAAELAEVDDQLSQLREQAASLRGDDPALRGAIEPEDAAADLTATQEVQALIDALQTRREDLARRIEENA